MPSLTAPEVASANPALLVSSIALGISALSFLLALFVAGWNVRSWRHSGARVDVRVEAWQTASDQSFQVSVINGGRGPITVNHVHLYASKDGRQPDSASPVMLLGTAAGEPLEDGPFRLDSQSSIELEAEVEKGRHLFGMPWYRVEVVLATGRVRSSRWIKNENTEV